MYGHNNITDPNGALSPYALDSYDVRSGLDTWGTAAMWVGGGLMVDSLPAEFVSAVRDTLHRHRDLTPAGTARRWAHSVRNAAGWVGGVTAALFSVGGRHGGADQDEGRAEQWRTEARRTTAVRLGGVG
jgi:hypothetical protein